MYVGQPHGAGHGKPGAHDRLRQNDRDRMGQTEIEPDRDGAERNRAKDALQHASIHIYNEEEKGSEKGMGEEDGREMERAN